VKIKRLVDIDTGVADRAVGEHSGTLGNTTGVFVEDNFTLVFNELALVPDAVNLTPGSRSSLEVVAGASQASF